MLRLLSTQLPLEAHGLSHLKRVRKVEGVACYARILPAACFHDHLRGDAVHR